MLDSSSNFMTATKNITVDKMSCTICVKHQRDIMLNNKLEDHIF